MKSFACSEIEEKADPKETSADFTFDSVSSSEEPANGERPESLERAKVTCSR